MIRKCLLGKHSNFFCLTDHLVTIFGKFQQAALKLAQLCNTDVVMENFPNLSQPGVLEMLPLCQQTLLAKNEF